MEEKTSRLSYFAQQVGLEINQRKDDGAQPIHVNGDALSTTNQSTYLGSTVRCDGAAHNDMKNE